MIHVTDAVVFDDREIKERFVRASGPGGQNVNKVATVAELRVDLRKSSLPADVKERLIALAGRRVTASGVLMIVSQVHRSQAQNRAAAHERLLTLLTRAAHPPAKRTRTKPRAGARERRLETKKRTSAVKRARRQRDED